MSGRSAEFDLLVDCCRGSFAETAVSVGRDIDWPLFLRLARFHRVQGLTWPAVAKVDIPADIAKALSNDAVNIAASNLMAARESKRLLDGFAEAGTEPLFVKGLTLGALAYRDIAVKAAVDIDLLIAEDGLEMAASLLQELGYRVQEPTGVYSLERLMAWHGPGKESTWVRSNPASVVDLHTRLSDNAALIPTLGRRSPRQTVEVINGIALPTLADEELVAYLCVHGASSAWFRLKWITDFAALLHRRTPADIEHLYRRSQELGAGRSAAQALLLADALYGTLAENGELRAELRSSAQSRWLFRKAFRQLAERREPAEPTAQRWGTATIHSTQFLLLPGVGFKLSEFLRQTRAALR